MADDHAARDRFRDLTNQLLQRNLRVHNVNLTGLKRVKSDVVVPFLKPLLATNTFGELVAATKVLRRTLEETDAFNEIVIDISKHAPSPSKEVVVSVCVKENRRITVGMTVKNDVNSTDGSFDVYGKLRNLFGRMESLSVKYSKGTNILSGCHVTLHKPIFPQLRSHVLLTTSTEQTLNRSSGFSTSDYLARLEYQFEGLGGLHVCQGDGLWQQIHGSKAPVAVREEYGHHTKFCVRHEYTRDRRDDNLTPTRGSRVSVKSELAGFLGDANHVRVDGDVSKSTRLPLGLAATLTARAGFIHTFSETSRVPITERFFCGGPGSVRGFFTDGVGNQAGGRPLGGLYHWGVGLSLHRHLPFSPYIWGLGKFMRLHGFVNTGSLESQPGELMAKPRVSVGSGLIIKVADRFKMEINYALPLLFAPGDTINRGFQFGIGINFL